ncbi:MAG: PIG-L family deacetylase [Lentisphaeraceae bacterium]|nr:PIG-L family deacetylase [Lentisphaeraceae bacterium]
MFELKYASELLETKRFYHQLKTIEMVNLDGKKVLVIAPHPDDELFGCGGAIMKSELSEATIFYVTTPGDDEETKQLIKEEALEVSGELNAKAVFNVCDPGEISLEIDSLSELIQEKLPDIIFVPFILDDHDDHRRVNHLLSRLLSRLKINCEIWSYQIYSTLLCNVAVDISAVIEKKKTSMAVYKTVSGDRDWGHYIQGLNAMNSRFLKGENVKYVESFFVLPSNDYIKLCDIYFRNSPDKIYLKNYF